jgi:hypothetical protein
VRPAKEPFCEERGFGREDGALQALGRSAMREITVRAGEVSADAELFEGSTADAIWEALPLEAPASTWGDEIYFSIPVVCDEEPDARADVAVGDLAYWPPGHAFCIFFGRTPASSGSAPRAASPVNVVGRVIGDATVFRRVRPGTVVRLARAG